MYEFNTATLCQPSPWINLTSAGTWLSCCFNTHTHNYPFLKTPFYKCANPFNLAAASIFTCENHSPCHMIAFYCRLEHLHKVHMVKNQLMEACLQSTCRRLHQKADVGRHRWKCWADSDGPASAAELAQFEGDSHSAPRLSHSQASMNWVGSLCRG